MDDHFKNSGDGDQNVAQSNGAIGKQENHYYNRPLKLRAVMLGLVLLVAISGAAFSLFAPVDIIGFTPRSKKASTQGGNSPATIAGHDATVNYNTGIAPEAFARYAGELAVTDAALASFFKILEEQQVPRADLDAKLREIAVQIKELQYLEQSLTITQEIGDKTGEGVILNNISQIYDTQGDYDTALRYLEQSLAIMQEIGAKMEEAVTSWNIGSIYKNQGNLRKAEQYMSRTVKIDEEIGRPELEWERKALEELRAKMRGP